MGKHCFYNPKSLATIIVFKVANCCNLEHDNKILSQVSNNSPQFLKHHCFQQNIMKESLTWTNNLEILLFGILNPC